MRILRSVLEWLAVVVGYAALILVLCFISTL